MLSKNLKYTLRTLRKNPVFAVTAVITIALGVAASTAIFSVTNGVLLRSLPYKDPDRLVIAAGDLLRRDVKDFQFSNADFLDIRNNARNSFEDFAAVNTGRGQVLRSDGTPEQVRFAAASTNFFRMMGAGIAFGRDFQVSDGTPDPGLAGNVGDPDVQLKPQFPQYVLLSHEYFERRFGGDRSVIGQRIPTAGGPSLIIAGVLSPGFELLFPPQADEEQFPDIWSAARIPYDTANRNNVQWRVIGRLKPGATLEAAQSEADAISEQLRNANAISKTAGLHVRIVPMKAHLVSEVRPAILSLMGAVIFLLLIACANVANLMLVRSAVNEREFAVRTALGGNMWQLVWQTLTEALVLSTFGTLMGMGLAWLGIYQLLNIAPANLPRLNAIGIDPIVLVFSAFIGLAAAAIFGVVPALRAARPDIMTVLRSSGRTAGLGGTGVLRNGVVVAEVALSFVLLIGSGLMFRTFLAIQRVDLGFDPKHLLTFQTLGNPGDKGPAREAFVRQLHERLATIPGVQSVAASFPMPLAGGFGPVRWGTSEALGDNTKFKAADLQIVLPGYFEAMRTTLVAGRFFTDADNTPDRKMLIVDQALAAKAFPGQSAVGKRILFRVRTPVAEWGEIVGVVAHERNSSLIDPGREQLYVTDGYVGHGVASWWAVRTTGDPTQYSSQIREEIHKIAPQFLVNQIQPMDALVLKAQAGTRFSLLLIGVFAIVAAVLAGVGLYGVLASLVRQRTMEIGVRMALGAAPSRIFGHVVGQGLRLSSVGIVLGFVAALGLTRIMTSLLVDVKPTDPATFAAISVLFLLIATLASWIPARRASLLHPTQALRDE